MKPLIYIIGVLIILYSCAQKKCETCGLASGINEINIESEIIKLKRIAVVDTTIVNIYGKVYTKSIVNKDTLTNSFADANIWVRDIKTDSLIGTTSDSKGEFQFTIPASEYDLQVQFIGFNNLKIKNLKVGTGDIINFSAILGQGDGLTEYKWNPKDFYNNNN